jgi:DNA-directed RNA polymerase subunit M/transcription elongation factor TFIIS
MAVSKVFCPECDSVLKLASQTPGKKVKCPRCGAKFELADEAEPPKKKSKDAGAAIKKAGDKSRKPAPKPAKPEKQEKPAAKPAARAGDDDDDEGGQTYGVVKEEETEEEKAKKPKITYAPDTSIRDLRGPAQEAVVGPTNLVILSGAIGFFGWIFLILILIFPVLFPMEPDEGTKDSPLKVLELPIAGLGGVGTGAGKAAGESDADDPPWLLFFGNNLALLANFNAGIVVLVVFLILLMMCYSGLTILGAVKAQNLESRQWGIVSSVMAMVPLNGGGVVVVVVVVLGFVLRMLFDEVNYVLIPLVVIYVLAGVAAGAWSLFVLNDEKVIDGFEYVPE